ncbi:CAF17-like 4Fe-4S cluster assembly/insertion protein YgfZ [Candidatus Contendibacter odensensis]|uniref:Glycine cleavage T protein (Aminomethyl transferase) n=1 Tax=Candidatus Contendobacter odensis Run_B_J11 TaxID=1400861 RepID=A0A7U7J451_9GAMM|nr:folate-binding protein YgfZ [Candidatus Contendobacter odensis]CDH45260.1 putative Glycine cleavage T protein (Aminomethyl transferase) [Candidatus Contendobacter odensis Run_B_J11]
MNVEWRDFLERAGAHWDSDSVIHFGQLDAESNAALRGDVCCDLSHLGLIAVHGPDAERFLQGQLTCDVRQVTPEHSLIGAHCNPKGRAVADFRLFQREDAYFLELPRTMVDPLLLRLCKYLLRAKAVLENASDALARIGVAGPNAASLLESAMGAVPATVNSVIAADNMIVIRLPGLQPRFELHGAARELGAIWNALARDLVPVGTESWRLLDILAGIPTIYPATMEAFVPQMINLQQLDGISFQKGCYTGQEIVARTHHLGKLKRRMYLARVDSATPPRPGDPLFSPQADASQSAGQLADACRHPNGGYAVLAVALIECAEQGELRLGDAGGPVLQLEPLPYEFDGAA